MAEASSNKYLKKRKNRDVWMFQIRIPKEIRYLYDGKEIYVQSLQTSCVKTARLRRDSLLGKIAIQKEQAIDGGRSTFLSFYNNLNQAKREARGNRREAYYQLEHSLLVGTEEHPEIRQEAAKAVESGIVPIKYTYSMREALNDWLNKNRQRNQDTIVKMKSTAERFLRHLNMHDTPLMSIERKQVISFTDQLIQEVSVSTIKGHLSRLKSIYDHAWRIAEIDQRENPFDSHILTHYEQDKVVEKKQLFSHEEINTIINWADSESDSIKALVYLGLYTGCRISEICAVTPADVYIEGNLMALYIRKGKTTAATRTVPLPTAVHEIVRKRLESVDAGQSLIGMDGKKASRVFSNFKSAKVTKDKSRTFHSFRVHMSTAYQRANVDESTAAFALGHKGGKTMTYGYYSKGEELRKLCENAEKAAEVIERDWL
ncbi:tyrosine-type recombinase/integrase [Pseudoalteromonas sp. GB56]